MADLDTIRPVLRALLRSCVDVHPTLAEAEVDADALVVVLGREGVESAIRRLAAEPSEQTAVPDLPPEALDELERLCAAPTDCTLGGDCSLSVAARNALPSLLASARRLAEVEAEVARLREQSGAVAAEAAAAEQERILELLAERHANAIDIEGRHELRDAHAAIRAPASPAPPSATTDREVIASGGLRWGKATQADRDRLREALRGLVKAYGVHPRRPDEEYPGCHALVVREPYGDWLDRWTAALAALEESDG